MPSAILKIIILLNYCYKLGREAGSVTFNSLKIFPSDRCCLSYGALSIDSDIYDFNMFKDEWNQHEQRKSRFSAIKHIIALQSFR